MLRERVLLLCQLRPALLEVALAEITAVQRDLGVERDGQFELPYAGVEIALPDHGQAQAEPGQRQQVVGADRVLEALLCGIGAQCDELREPLHRVGPREYGTADLRLHVGVGVCGPLRRIDRRLRMLERRRGVLVGQRELCQAGLDQRLYGRVRGIGVAFGAFGLGHGPGEIELGLFDVRHHEAGVDRCRIPVDGALRVGAGDRLVGLVIGPVPLVAFQRNQAAQRQAIRVGGGLQHAAGAGDVANVYETQSGQQAGVGRHFARCVEQRTDPGGKCLRIAATDHGLDVGRIGLAARGAAETPGEPDQWRVIDRPVDGIIRRDRQFDPARRHTRERDDAVVVAGRTAVESELVAR